MSRETRRADELDIREMQLVRRGPPSRLTTYDVVGGQGLGDLIRDMLSLSNAGFA